MKKKISRRRIKIAQKNRKASSAVPGVRFLAASSATSLMELGSSLSLNSTRLGTSFGLTNPEINRRRGKTKIVPRVSAFSYQELVLPALRETRRYADLKPSSLQERYGCITAIDGKTELKMAAFKSSKIRLLRSMNIESEKMQVLDFAAFMEPEFDIPIFCANIFSSTNMNIVVLDLNPLHDMISQANYQEKYYKNLMPLYHKYGELLPWGGKLTAESIKFFSPIVIWSKFTSSQEKLEVLFSVFMDYYQAWLTLMNQAVEEKDPYQVMLNREAQHRYLTWRAEKDPGHAVLERLVGKTRAKDLLRDFLFNGVDELGSKTFLQYFPEYGHADGTVSCKRSIIGRSFENRPWNSRGEFIGENSGS